MPKYEGVFVRVFQYLSQGPEVCIYTCLPLRHSHWGCLMAVFNAITVIPLRGLN